MNIEGKTTMNRDVIISITGREQLVEESYSDKIELVTEGKYYKKGKNYYISYNETEMTGFDNGTKTTLKVEGDKVTMTRFGSVNTHMVFKQGEKYLGHYETAYGSFTVGIVADEVSINIGDCGGDIEIKYMLEIDNATKAAHDLTFNIRNA